MPQVRSPKIPALVLLVLIATTRVARADTEGTNDHNTGQYKFPLPSESGITKVIIEIGLYNGIYKPAEDEFVIAIDASLKEIEKYNLFTRCHTIKRCHLINAAIGDGADPFVTLHTSARGGGSSHIGSFSTDVYSMETKPDIVRLTSLKSIIDSIPGRYRIVLLKTDTNGNDGGVIKSAGSSLARVERIRMEVVSDRVGTGPKGQLQTAIDVTAQQGFGLDHSLGRKDCNSNSRSCDVFFTRTDVQTAELSGNGDARVWGKLHPQR